MSHHRFMRKLSLTLSLLVMPLTAQSGLPIFDSHLHYGGEDVASFSTDQIIVLSDNYPGRSSDNYLGRLI